MIFAVLTVRTVSRGETLMLQGSRADGLGVLLHGALAVYKRAENPPKRSRNALGVFVCALEPGDAFGERSLLDARSASLPPGEDEAAAASVPAYASEAAAAAGGASSTGRRTASIVATAESVLLWLSADSFREVFERHILAQAGGSRRGSIIQWSPQAARALLGAPRAARAAGAVAARAHEAPSHAEAVAVAVEAAASGHRSAHDLDTIAAYLFTFAFFRQIERDALRRIAARATLHVVFPGDDATVITRPAGESGEASGSAGSGGASSEPLISLLVLVGCVEATSKPAEASADARVGETAGRSAWQLHASDWAEIGTLRAGDAFPDALAAAGKALETMLASNARSRSDAFQLPRRWVAKEACEVRTSCDPSR